MLSSNLFSTPGLAYFETRTPYNPGHRAEELFTPHQRQALQEYNTLLISLNVSEINTNNQLAALELFFARHNNSDPAVQGLDNAFKRLYGHWVNGEGPKASLRKILTRLGQEDLNSLCGLEHYRASFVKMQTTAPPGKRSHGNNAVCLAHPNRKAIAKRGLCSSCYTKAFRLNLLQLPVSQWLITLLKKRKPRDASQCVNHAKIPAYADGLCVECLRKAKKLAPLLGLENLCHAG